VVAYLDGASGSMIISAVVAGAAGAGVAVRQARHRLASKFSRKGGEPEGDETADAEPAPGPAASDA
jgi:hypothetical protein